MLRPGNAGSNHAGDHIDVLGRAIAQVPAAHRSRLLVRADGAGATHGLLDWLTGPAQVRGRRLEYSVGFPDQEHRADQRHHHRSGAGVDAGDRRRRPDPRRR